MRRENTYYCGSSMSYHIVGGSKPHVDSGCQYPERVQQQSDQRKNRKSGVLPIHYT